ncbi:MAG TPA: hypothetical protein DDW52_10670 [Planctomycetaceae bacterium]|nr:hypothetical protein [Planctomycetaceae bacterium]
MPNSEETKFSLKDELFNRRKVVYLAELLAEAEPKFDQTDFVKQTMRGFKKLELKERISRIADSLQNHLADDFPSACKHIVACLPPPLDPSRTDDDFGDFIFAPLGEYVVREGLTKAKLSRALQTLKELTKRFSMEDSIRAFINAFPDRTLVALEKWAKDKNYHVRRLVSEGTRPTLPWSKRLTIDRLTPLRLLDQLYSDPTRYVVRSVANHLNDIAKADASVVLERLKQWKLEGRQRPEEFEWMAKHALRTLVKRGDSAALAFLGYRDKPKITVGSFSVSPNKVKPGDSIQIDVDLSAKQAEALIVDYVIDFVKANGLTAPKVHKLKQLTLAAGQSAHLSKKHTLKANATTYRLYPGEHRVTLQVNGQQLASKMFELAK